MIIACSGKFLSENDIKELLPKSARVLGIDAAVRRKRYY